MKKTAKFIAVLFMAFTCLMPLTANDLDAAQAVVDSFLVYLNTQEMEALSPVIGITPDMFGDQEREYMIDTLWQALDYAGCWVNDIVMDEEQIKLDFEADTMHLEIEIEEDGTIKFDLFDYSDSMNSVISFDDEGNVIFTRYDKSLDYSTSCNSTFTYYLYVNDIEEGDLVESVEGWDLERGDNGYNCYYYTLSSPAGMLVNEGWEGNDREWKNWMGEEEDGISMIVGKDSSYDEENLSKIWLLEEGDEWAPDWFIGKGYFPEDTGFSLHYFDYGIPTEWTNRGPILIINGDVVVEKFYVEESLSDVEAVLDGFYSSQGRYDYESGDGYVAYDSGNVRIEVFTETDDATSIWMRFEGLRSYDAMKIRKTIVYPELD